MKSISLAYCFGWVIHTIELFKRHRPNRLAEWAVQGLSFINHLCTWQLFLTWCNARYQQTQSFRGLKELIQHYFIYILSFSLQERRKNWRALFQENLYNSILFFSSFFKNISVHFNNAIKTKDLAQVFLYKANVCVHFCNISIFLVNKKGFGACWPPFPTFKTFDWLILDQSLPTGDIWFQHGGVYMAKKWRLNWLHFIWAGSMSFGTIESSHVHPVSNAHWLHSG